MNLLQYLNWPPSTSPSIRFDSYRFHSPPYGFINSCGPNRHRFLIGILFVFSVSFSHEFADDKNSGGCRTCLTNLFLIRNSFSRFPLVCIGRGSQQDTLLCLITLISYFSLCFDANSSSLLTGICRLNPSSICHSSPNGLLSNTHGGSLCLLTTQCENTIYTFHLIMWLKFYKL